MKSTETGKWRERYPLRYWAHRATASALKSGLIERQPCEKCGAEPTDAHHEDYDRPLAIQWLCRSCHGQHYADKRRAGRGA